MRANPLRRLLSALFLLAAAATTAVKAIDSSPPNFLFVGDWGGASDDEPTTEAQVQVSSGFKIVADKLNADRIYLL